MQACMRLIYLRPMGGPAHAHYTDRQKQYCRYFSSYRQVIADKQGVIIEFCCVAEGKDKKKVNIISGKFSLSPCIYLLDPLVLKRLQF